MAEKKAGRPAGSVANPESLLRTEMKATANLARNMREMIEAEMKVLRQQLKDKDTTIAQRLEVLASCGNLLGALTKNMEAAAKYLLKPTSTAKESSTDEEGDVQKLLEEMTEGRR